MTTFHVLKIPAPPTRESSDAMMKHGVAVLAVALVFLVVGLQVGPTLLPAVACAFCACKAFAHDRGPAAHSMHPTSCKASVAACLRMQSRSIANSCAFKCKGSLDGRGL